MCQVYFILLISLLRYSNFSAVHLKFNSAHSHIARPELSLEAFFLTQGFCKTIKKKKKRKRSYFKSFILTFLMLKKTNKQAELFHKSQTDMAFIIFVSELVKKWERTS